MAAAWLGYGRAEGYFREKIQSASRFEFLRVESMAGVWLGYGRAEGNFRDKIQSASHFEFFRVESIAGAWLGYCWGMPGALPNQL